jgi:hypothetical protein
LPVPGKRQSPGSTRRQPDLGGRISPRRKRTSGNSAAARIAFETTISILQPVVDDCGLDAFEEIRKLAPVLGDK